MHSALPSYIIAAEKNSVAGGRASDASIEESRRFVMVVQKKRIRKSLPYYVLILLPLVYLLVFRYYPMLGIQIAFRDFKVRGGIWNSPWVGMKHFEL